MGTLIRMAWAITTIGIYLLGVDTMPTPEAKFFALLLALLFASPLPFALWLFQKEVLRFR